MLDISGHKAIEEGYVTVDHSISGMKKGDAIDPSKVNYLLMNLHGPSHNFAFPKDVEDWLPQDHELFQRYINSENDAGAHALTQAFLDQNPGGLALTVEPSRGVLDNNRLNAQKAVINVLREGTPEQVRQVLYGMHAQTQQLLDAVPQALSKGTKILHLHSMEPFTVGKTERQPVRYDNMRAFIEAYGKHTVTDASRRKIDVITGTNGQAPVADMEMSNAIMQLLLENGHAADFNGAYDTDADYPDYRDMVAYPNSVFAIDLLKTNLCVGDETTFDTTDWTVDEKKVLSMTELLQEGMRRTLRKTRR